MNTKTFLSLNEAEKMELIKRSGKLKVSLIADDQQVTLYKVKDFYVELKRRIQELTFEKITPMGYEELPVQYKEVCRPKFWS